jgi:hypothetical protein
MDDRVLGGRVPAYLPNPKLAVSFLIQSGAFSPEDEVLTFRLIAEIPNVGRGFPKGAAVASAFALIPLLDLSAMHAHSILVTDPFVPASSFSFDDSYKSCNVPGADSRW